MCDCDRRTCVCVLVCAKIDANLQQQQQHACACVCGWKNVRSGFAIHSVDVRWYAVSCLVCVCVFACVCGVIELIARLLRASHVCVLGIGEPFESFIKHCDVNRSEREIYIVRTSLV